MQTQHFNYAFMGAIALMLSTFGAFAQDRVTIANGILEGQTEPSGVHSFKGIPFAQPPVGDLRWRPPQPPKNWEGVRKANKFGPRAMQNPVFGDMAFRSDGMSEDCLYLNVWTPPEAGKKKLPVLVYFYGGGFVGGDGSEGRYDGESMARKGIISLTVNYRLGVFGFFSHPELTTESPQHASGNYGLLDQNAALLWVQKNIAAFGGDPKRVTIAGESAGSISVSAQMASPLSKGVFAGAIGESGSILGALSAEPLAETEKMGLRFAAGLGKGEKTSLADLRSMSAEDLLKASGKPGAPWFVPAVDGYFFPREPWNIFAAGNQAHVPLLAGANSEEMNAQMVLGGQKPTVENYRKALERLYPGKVDEIFKLYPACNEREVLDAAQNLAGDRFIAYSAWKWMDLSTKTGEKPTYYYLYAHPRPAKINSSSKSPESRGAVHSAEIEYAMGNLNFNKTYAWTRDDFNVSALMQSYFVNFIKTGNPNGRGLPKWPKFEHKQRLVIDVNTCAQKFTQDARYKFLDSYFMPKSALK